MPVRFTSALLFAAAVAHASVQPASYTDTDGERLPSRWYHEEDHPVHSLFRRAGNNDGVAYAAIGTPGMFFFCVESLLVVCLRALGRMVCGFSRRRRFDHEHAPGMDQCVEQCRHGGQDSRYSSVHELWGEPNVSFGL